MIKVDINFEKHYMVCPLLDCPADMMMYDTKFSTMVLLNLVLVRPYPDSTGTPVFTAVLNLPKWPCTDTYRI
eukprot:SAG11_NODE_131_length_15487_cov_5.744996_6_plen_72_part_00